MVNIIGEMYIILGEDNSGKQTLYWDTLYMDKEAAVNSLRNRIYNNMEHYINNSIIKLEIGTDYASIVNTYTNTIVMKLITIRVNDLIEDKEDAE